MKQSCISLKHRQRKKQEKEDDIRPIECWDLGTNHHHNHQTWIKKKFQHSTSLGDISGEVILIYHST